MEKTTLTGPVLISETTDYRELVILPDAVLSAPQGKNLTLTVDHVQRDITPGTYTGKVRLTVADGFGRPSAIAPPGTPVSESFTAAVRGINGRVIPEQSVLEAVQSGDLANGLSIRTEGSLMAGVDLEGGNWTINKADIQMKGYGGSDFNGWGCAMTFAGDATAELSEINISTAGVVRSGVIVTDNANVRIKDSTIVTMGGDEAQFQSAQKAVGGMQSVPWQLGLQGNCRATSLLHRGSAAYEGCTLKSYGWGVLSVDGADGVANWDEHSVHLTAKDCDVEILGPSGYGAFSIGPSLDVFENTAFRVKDYGLILANETASAQFLHSRVHSDRFGVMSYSNQGGELLVQDSEFQTGSAVFLIKGAYPQIRVERSVLSPANGTILQMIDLDDPNMGGGNGKFDWKEPQKLQTHDVTKVNYHDLTMYQGLLKAKDRPTDVCVSFQDMEMRGNLYNGITNRCAVGFLYGVDPDADDGVDVGDKPYTNYPINLSVTFDNTVYAGVITASRARHRVEDCTPENYREIGVVTNTPCPVVNNGVIVTLENGSSWTVTGDCFLSALHIGQDAVVSGQDGRGICMTVDGVKTPAVPGNYTGDIQIKLE